jgi:hypothetical protein
LADLVHIGLRELFGWLARRIIELILVPRKERDGHFDLKFGNFHACVTLSKGANHVDNDLNKDGIDRIQTLKNFIRKLLTVRR